MINAGFPINSFHTRAYEMMNPEICPHVCKAIQSYRDELDENFLLLCWLWSFRDVIQSSIVASSHPAALPPWTSLKGAGNLPFAINS